MLMNFWRVRRLNRDQIVLGLRARSTDPHLCMFLSDKMPQDTKVSLFFGVGE